MQKNRTDLPCYEIERTDNGFISSVTIKLGQDKAQHFKGTHQATKKAAEQDCAKKACLELKIVGKTFWSSPEGNKCAAESMAAAQALDSLSRVGHEESQDQIPTKLSQFTEPASKKINMSNYKSALNLYCQKKGIPVPHYVVTYPEDAVGYIATVTVQGKTFLSPPEGNKRAAESMAAAQALDSLGVSVEVGHEESQDQIPTKLSQFTEPASKKINMSNYKSALNLYCQKKGIPVPHYVVTYPEDAVGYIATVTVQGKTFLSPPEGNKRAAESMAAAQALDNLGVSVEVGHEESQDQIPTKQPGATLVSTPSVPSEYYNSSYNNVYMYLQSMLIVKLFFPLNLHANCM